MTTGAKWRRIKALRMRLAGSTWEWIADELDYANARSAKAAVTAIMQDEVGPAAEEYRDRQSLQIDAIMQTMLPQAVGGDVKAAMACVHLMKRQAKLLGLDAPEEKEITGPGGGPIPLRAGAVIAAIQGLSDPELDAVIRHLCGPGDATDAERAPEPIQLPPPLPAGEE